MDLKFDLLFKDMTVVTMTENKALSDTSVGIKDGKIAYIGPYKPELSADRVIEKPYGVLMPSLINTHTHSPMCLIRGYGADLNLQDWLYNYIFPAEGQFTAQMPYIGANLMIAEMISSGTTAFTDMYFGMDTVTRAVAETGVKINASNAIMAFDHSGYDLTQTPSYTETMAILADYHHAYNGRIKAEASIHAEYTSYNDAWEQTVEFAKKHGLRMHVHLSETKTEHEECKARYGMTPTQILDKHHVFDIPTTAAHCVWVEDSDMDIMAERKVNAAHNPVSNLKLASGISPVVKMQQRGINVSIGTDSVASNDSIDMFQELKIAGILQKAVCADPTVVPAYEVLRMATANGAITQGRENECGQIKVGMDADIILLDFDTPRQTVCTDVISALAYSTDGRDVVMTLCQGKVLYENGEYKTLDIERVLYEAREAAKQLNLKK